MVCGYTPLELDLALLENALAWLARLQKNEAQTKLQQEIWEKWSARLVKRSTDSIDAQERELLAEAHEALVHAAIP